MDLRRILCPSDFSDVSSHALEHAIVLAKWYEARLLALHVYNPVLVPGAGLGLPGYADVVAADVGDTSRLHQRLREWFEPAISAGLDVETEVVSGPTAKRIAEASRSADLIVIGTHGLSGFEYPMLGSVTEKVLRKSQCPVLTVPPRSRATSRLPFRKVLCATDFSEPSLAAVEFAFSLAKEGDAELIVLHVIEWPETEAPLLTTPFDVPEYRRLREAGARHELDALVPQDARSWCDPVLRLTHGKPYREIVGTANEESCDLIVMGVRGRGTIDLAFFGSTTNQVVRQATCPVLTVRR